MVQPLPSPFPSPMSVVERARREVERNALRVRNVIRSAAGRSCWRTSSTACGPAWTSSAYRTNWAGPRPDTAKATVR